VKFLVTLWQSARCSLTHNRSDIYRMAGRIIVATASEANASLQDGVEYLMATDYERMLPAHFPVLRRRPQARQTGC